MPVSPATTAGAERVEQAVDERDGVPVLVHDREISRVAAHLDLAVGRRIDRLVGIDERAALRRVVPGQQLLDGHLGERRVGDVAVAIREGNLRRLDERVVVARRIVPHRRQVDAFEDVEQQQRGEPLVVRRKFVKGVAAVGRRDRLDPRGLVLREILHRQIPAVLLAVVDDGPADLAAVVGVAPALGERAERAGEILLDEDVAGLRRLAVHEIGRRGRRRASQLLDLGNPVGDGFLHHREAVFGERNRRRQQIRQLHRPVLLEQRHPPVERAGHGDGLHAGEAASACGRGRPRARRSARAARGRSR